MLASDIISSLSVITVLLFALSPSPSPSLFFLLYLPPPPPHIALCQGIGEILSLPIVTVHPDSAVVAQGDSVDLRCEATNANMPLQFTHNGVVIDENDPDRSITSNNLNIRNFVAGFEGEYVCLARNQVGDVTYTVASAPAFIQLRGE